MARKGSESQVIEQLIKVLEVVFKTAERIREHGRKVSNERQQLALLTVQFCFVGISETGRELLELSGSQPLRHLTNLSADDLRNFNALAQRHISIQLGRLQKLHGLLEDETVLDLFDTSLRSEIRDAIGDKEQGLYSIGAGLLFYVFLLRPALDSQKPEDLERTAEIICAMYPEIERGIISVEKAKKMFDSIVELNQRYKQILHRIIPAEAALRLSNEASKLANVD